MRHALIMAGGSGTRLWPLSRRSRPKQLLPLIAGRSLLQVARDRLSPLFEPHRIHIITSEHYLDAVAEALPDIPRANLIGEPAGRDTANAIGLVAHRLAASDPAALMAVFTADHLITPPDRFQAAIERGVAAAEQHPDALITFGIKATEPHTGYGYIEQGEALQPDLFSVRRFREKPDAAAAADYIATGRFWWNSGMFAWRAETLLSELARVAAGPAAKLRETAELYERGDAEWRARFASLEAFSIDRGVMEKAARVLMVPMDVDWLDLGAWPAFETILEADAAGNRSQSLAGGPARVLAADSERNLVVAPADHLVTLLGVRDLLLIHTPDATLVCARGAVDRLKELVARVGERYGEQYL